LLEAVKTGPQNVLLDFSQLDYISSAGLRVLLVVTRALQEKQGAMALCALKPALKNVFDIAGFSQFFPIHTSLEEATAQFAK
jgi:stage II sporulation protein AA (anti-sigma F factor antagonist)